MKIELDVTLFTHKDFPQGFSGGEYVVGLDQYGRWWFINQKGKNSRNIERVKNAEAYPRFVTEGIWIGIDKLPWE
jgi:hypothetical protein